MESSEGNARPRAMLRRLAKEGLRRRFGERRDDHAAQLEEELTIIDLSSAWRN